MAAEEPVGEILKRHLRDPRSTFSVGGFGAIGEFARDPEEPLEEESLDSVASGILAVATGRGALRIAIDEFKDKIEPRTYEIPSPRSGHWQHGVVFCLPAVLARSRRCTVLTELGPDREAIRAEDRDATLFDMGASVANVDFCIRTRDPVLLGILRRACGLPLIGAKNEAIEAIIDSSPHRVIVSRFARIEVFQEISRIRTPEGPHTHLLPKLLASGRTHSAHIPVPRHSLPCLSLYPEHPLGVARCGADGEKAAAAFETLLRRWSAPEYYREKTRARCGLDRGVAPEDYRAPGTRLGRAALRMAIRERGHAGGDSPLLARWAEAFDGGYHSQREED